MKASMLWTSAALAAAIGQWPIQASADITALQAKELRMMAGAQMQQAAAMARGYMVGMVEGCAQSHPSLRPSAVAAYSELGMKADLSAVFGACLDKDHVPDESKCRNLIQHAKPPQSVEALSAFFDLPGAQSAKKIVAACN